MVKLKGEISSEEDPPKSCHSNTARDRKIELLQSLVNPHGVDRKMNCIRRRNHRWKGTRHSENIMGVEIERLLQSGAYGK